MNITRKKLEDSILLLASEILNKRAIYNIFIQHDSELKDIVNMLVEDLFLNKFCHNNVDDKILSAYEIVYDFKKQIHEKGFYDFI